MNRIVFKLIIVIVLTVGCSSTKRTGHSIVPVVPKKGVVVFEKEVVVLNEDLLDSSLVAIEEKFMSTIYSNFDLEDDTDDPYKDSLMMIPAMLKENLIKLDPRKSKQEPLSYFQEFRDSTIVHYVKENLEVIGNYKYIFPKEHTYGIALDSILAMKITKNKPYQYLDTGTIKFNEINPDDRKNIHGYDCFKVIITVTPENSINAAQSLEMYVTDKIKCRYHPVVDFKEILEQFYPLEIVSKNPAIQGLEIRYRPIKVNIKGGA